jgi:hypothetical protein
VKFQNIPKLLSLTKIFCAAVLLAICSVGQASADTITEGSVLPNYAVVSVGPNASLTVNSGPITGNVLIGDGSTSSSSGGGNGQVTGTVDVSPAESGDSLSHIQIPPNIHPVSSSVGTQAFSDAGKLSSTAAGLSATQTFGAINGTLIINGNGGLNVIDVTSLQNPLLTINGNAHDFFVFNVSGLFNTNQVITLHGVTAGQILWNFTATSGTVFQTSGGDGLFGTFLATDGGDFQFSNLVLTGQLINTDGHIQLVSGSGVTGSPLTPPVPEPGSLMLFGTGLLSIAGLARKRILRK